MLNQEKAKILIHQTWYACCRRVFLCLQLLKSWSQLSSTSFIRGFILLLAGWLEASMLSPSWGNISWFSLNAASSLLIVNFMQTEKDYDIFRHCYTLMCACTLLRLARISASKLWCFSSLACRFIGSLQLSSTATEFFSFSHEEICTKDNYISDVKNRSM